jgi:hypothetical protein
MYSDEQEELSNLISKVNVVTPAERAERVEAARIAAAREKQEKIKEINNLIKANGLESSSIRLFERFNGNMSRIRAFLEEQRATKNNRTSASINAFKKSGIHNPSTKPNSGMGGGNKSRRNARTYRHSKKHKRVRHTRRKRTRRNHRSRRHR